MKLEKDKWYKFDPYNDDWSTTWWMKSTGEGNPPSSNWTSSKHIDNSNRIHAGGQFGDYESYQNYVEATPEETAWLENIFITNKYYPLPVQEINNEYSIF